MAIDGLLAEEELAGNGLIGLARRNEAEHLDFSRSARACQVGIRSCRRWRGHRIGRARRVPRQVGRTPFSRRRAWGCAVLVAERETRANSSRMWRSNTAPDTLPDLLRAAQRAPRAGVAVRQRDRALRVLRHRASTSTAPIGERVQFFNRRALANLRCCQQNLDMRRRKRALQRIRGHRHHTTGGGRRQIDAILRDAKQCQPRAWIVRSLASLWRARRPPFSTQPVNFAP